MEQGPDDPASREPLVERGGMEPRRGFEDERGVVWTAELRRPRAAVAEGRRGGAMILFSSETRACLAPLPPGRAFSELTTEELRQQLHHCISE